MKSMLKFMSVLAFAFALVFSAVGCRDNSGGGAGSSVKPVVEAPAVVTPKVEPPAITAAELREVADRLAGVEARIAATEKQVALLSEKSDQTSSALAGLVEAAAADRRIAASAQSRATAGLWFVFVLAVVAGALIKHTAMSVNPVPGLKKLMTRRGRDLRPDDRAFSDSDLGRKAPVAQAAVAHPTPAGEPEVKAPDPLQALADGEVPVGLGEPGVIQPA